MNRAPFLIAAATSVFLICAAALGAVPFSGAAALDRAIHEAIEAGKLPGAVVLIGHKGRIVYRKAYGSRSLEPSREPMTTETIFDAASLTKILATSSSIMKLFEQGRIRLNDRVTDYLPEFQGGDSPITIRNLMTHFSGLRPDVDLKPVWDGYETGVALALKDRPVAKPGERFIYSDINFVLLGEIVHRLSGESLADFAERQVFRPLGMAHTRFLPPAAWKDQIAPTEHLPGTPAALRGVVHDPTARYMHGIAGHAGVFTTADDLAKFAEMIVGGGSRGPVRLFTPLTIRKFTTPQTPPNQPILRGLGWDIDSPFSGNRGELFPVGSFGHTGFTGTSLWIDPWSQTYVILLTNSVHPKIRPAITSLRGKVATIAAAALGVNQQTVRITGYSEAYYGSGLRLEVAPQTEVLTGLDAMVRNRFLPLQGKKVGLVTNHSGRDRQGIPNLQRLREAGIPVAALFSPEHGLYGTEDREGIADSREAATGIPVFSLYGKTRRPTPEQLRGLDALVFDIADAGVRFYTYVTTMGYCLEEAAKAHVAFYVLDRPNPLNGVAVEGPLLDSDLLSFIGYFPLPLRHGMTMGELARLFNAQKKLGADLTVVPMENWERGEWFDSTGLTWIDPSPNLRSLNATILYPGLALLEASSNYSVGRGTDSPFEQIGAEWIDGTALAIHLNERKIPGVRVYPTEFQPSADAKLGGKRLSGVRFVLTDRNAFSALRLGLEIASALDQLFPGNVQWEENRKLIGSRATIDKLRQGMDPRKLHEEIQESLSVSDFARQRADALLY